MCSLCWIILAKEVAATISGDWNFFARWFTPHGLPGFTDSKDDVHLLTTYIEKEMKCFWKAYDCGHRIIICLQFHQTRGFWFGVSLQRYQADGTNNHRKKSLYSGRKCFRLVYIILVRYLISVILRPYKQPLILLIFRVK